MMYYTGTKTELQAYLDEVNKGENYQGSTSKWADIIKHHSQYKYAVIAHPKYPSAMRTLNNLNGWYNEQES